MIIEVTCRVCGHAYTPPRLAFVLGTWKDSRWCEHCHPPTAEHLQAPTEVEAEGD